MLLLLKTLQRTDKINAVEIEPGAVTVDAVRIEGVADDGILGFFVGFHAIALHQTLGRIHLYITIGVDLFGVTVPVESVGEGVFAFGVVLDVDVAESKPLLLPHYGVVAGSVGVDLRLEQAVGSISKHFEAAGIKFVGVLDASCVFIIEALHESGPHVVCQVVTLETTCNHPVHRLHRNLREVDGGIINIGAFARSKGTDDKSYENNLFQLFEGTNRCAFTHTSARYGVAVAVLNVIHEGVSLLREVAAILC